MGCILDCRKTTVPAEFDQQEINVNLTPKDVPDLVLYGKVTDCVTGNPLVGAVVKVFVCLEGTEYVVGHTYSGCEGNYLFNIPPRPTGIPSELLPIPAGSTILVKATCTNNPPTPCVDCATADCNCT